MRSARFADADGCSLLHTGGGAKYGLITCSFPGRGGGSATKPINPILNDNTWAEISAASANGTAQNVWSVGDTKNIIINGKVGSTTFTNLSIDVFILGFNHNATIEGDNLIHFQIGKIDGVDIAFIDENYCAYSLSTTHFQMNETNTNHGGWNGSNMRRVLLGNNGTPTSPLGSSFLACLPLGLIPVMKQCIKYSDNTGGGNDTASHVTKTMDYLTLLSEFEINGVRTNANSAEQNFQTQYEYYLAGNSNVKYKHNDNTKTAYCWSRSARYAGTAAFCRSDAVASAAYFSYGIAPCFFV